MNKTKILFSAWIVAVVLAVASVSPSLVYAQDVGTDIPDLPPFPVGVNNTTLTIALIGGVSGALIANYWGKNEEDNKKEQWDVLKFAKTFVFSILTGVPTVLTFTGIFEIGTTNAAQAFVLWVYATAFVVMVERARQKS